MIRRARKLVRVGRLLLAVPLLLLAWLIAGGTLLASEDGDD